MNYDDQESRERIVQLEQDSSLATGLQMASIIQKRNILDSQSQYQNIQSQKALSERKSKQKFRIFILLMLLLCLGGIYFSKQLTDAQKQIEQMTKQRKFQVHANPFKLIKAGPGKHDLVVPHDHQAITLTSATVGVPEPGKQFNSTIVDQKDLAAFDTVILQLFKPFNDTDCDYTRVGAEHDGGYVICENYLSGEALINFGIEANDQFGCQLTSMVLIPNYQYDCTIPTPPTCSNKNSLDVWSNICMGQISEVTQDRTFYTLWDILKSRNLVKKHIVMKIDVEGSQYFIFKYFPIELLKYIDQILIQFHFSTKGPQTWGNLDIFKTLADNFVNVNYHVNNNGCYETFLPQVLPYRKLRSHAIELTLINKRIIKKKSESRSFKAHPLNTINDPKFIDCQMEP